MLVASPAVMERNMRHTAAKARSRAAIKARKESFAAQSDAGGEALTDGEALMDSTALAGGEAPVDGDAPVRREAPEGGGAPVADTAPPDGERLGYGEHPVVDGVLAAVWGRQQTARDAQDKAVIRASEFGTHVSDRRGDIRSSLLVAAFDRAQWMLHSSHVEGVALAAAVHRRAVVTDAERAAAVLWSSTHSSVLYPIMSMKVGHP